MAHKQTKQELQVGRTIHAIVRLLQFSIFVGVVWMTVIGNWEGAFINLLALGFAFAPEIIQKRTKVVIPPDYILVAVVFIYLSMFLDTFLNIYDRFFWWDALLHTTSGILFSLIGFLVLYTLYKQKKLVTSAFIIATFTFAIGLAVGAVWEIFEYTVDGIAGTNLQKSGLTDTMWDLIVDALGALITSYAAYDIIKNGNDGGVIHGLVESFVKNNKRLFK